MKRRPSSSDDDVDPELYFGRNRRPDIHALQLCHEASRALSYALAGDFDDDVLLGLLVESVEPTDGTSLLTVTVSTDCDPALVLERLKRARGSLRAAVAAYISRRKAPDLAFRVEVRP
jgi:ribosome-binding factor A